MIPKSTARQRKRWVAIAATAAIALGSAVVTLLLGNVRFIQLVHLKAQDFHFLLRGQIPIRDIVLITVDKKSLSTYKELLSFWQPYYADAIHGANVGGAKVLGLDVTFLVPVNQYVPGNDEKLAEALISTQATMPVICSIVPAMLTNQSEKGWTVPINMAAAAFGQFGMANLTVDPDDFVRSQELIEAPDPAKPGDPLTRGLALRVAEKFAGEDAKFDSGKFVWRGRQIPIGPDRSIKINFAGGPDTFPRVPLTDVVEAFRKGEKAKLQEWFKGKAVLLGPDNVDDRHATPFYTPFSTRWNTAGVEIHASTLRTLLENDYLVPMPEAGRILFLGGVTTATAIIAASFAASQAALLLFASVVVTALLSHLWFRDGIVVSTSELLLGCLVSLIGSIIYRLLTAEKTGALFQSAVSVFVGKKLATSLSEEGKITLSGSREMVTILFSDIRGFTAFCEEKDPGLVVDLLNEYMGDMVKVIVGHQGNVNKFIGDGILAIFSDEDDGARPGDHALRAVHCGIAMAKVRGRFKTGVGIHSGMAVVGNVGSQDKMEYTVLGDTVNLASRLESLNKEMKTQLLLSEATKELMDAQPDAEECVFLGAVPVRGKTVPLNLYTAAQLHQLKPAEPVMVAEKSS